MFGAVNPPSLKAPLAPEAFCAANPASAVCQPGGTLFCRISPNDLSCLAPATATYQTSHWGLMVAALVSAFVVYKFATR